MLRILLSDEDFVAVDKPAGFHVHPPEDTVHRIPLHESCLHVLRDQLGRYVYPVHRLDRATSGVLLFALTSETASILGGQFAAREVRKTYCTLVRGYLPDRGTIDRPLDGKESSTDYESLLRWEAPWPSGKHATSRYTIARVSPHTGRMHQIRRHLAGISHPIVGDTLYGDGVHNRAWRAHTGDQLLYLKASRLEFAHPRTKAKTLCLSRWGGEWQRVFDVFGACPTYGRGALDDQSKSLILP